MSFFDLILLSVMILIFPLVFSLVLIAYFSDFNNNQKLIIFDIACLSSTYILIKYHIYFGNSMLVLLANIPFLICIFNKRYLVTFVISFILAYYYNFLFGLNIYLLLFEYLFYILIFLKLFKKDNFHIILFVFTTIKSIIMGIIVFEVYKTNLYMNAIEFLLMIVLFVILAEIINILIVKGLSAISINTAKRDLAKEKELRSSLFKITHEVKNPLAVCKGYISMIDYKDTKKSIKYIKIIKSEIDRTLDILDNFSQYTKINIKKEKMDLVLLINDTFDDLKELCFNKSIKFSKNVKIHSACINGDYNRLKQVIVNMFKNSIESINDEGKINISLTSDKNSYYVEIEDNGIGMDKETLNRLGEMFFTTKDNGTGIGVSLCKEIIKQHEGEIVYESVLNHGTKATIRLIKL